MRLTISTVSYINELMDWMKHNDYNKYIEKYEMVNDSCIVTIGAPECFTRNITALFETIILEKNQVARVHSRLKRLLLNMVFEPSKEEIYGLINKYVSNCEHINLEGFVTFRLGGYSRMLDLVLYATVKNALRGINS